MVDWSTVGTSVTLSGIASLIVSIVAFEYQQRREQTIESREEMSEWYEKSASLASHAKTTWTGRFVEPSQRGHPNYAEVQSKMNQIAGRIERHTSGISQNKVDDTVLEQLNELASKCREVNEIIIHTNAHSKFIEIGDQMMEIADELEQNARDSS